MPPRKFGILIQPKNKFTGEHISGRTMYPVIYDSFDAANEQKHLIESNTMLEDMAFVCDYTVVELMPAISSHNHEE